jgi:hypothetical protein
MFVTQQKAGVYRLAGQSRAKLGCGDQPVYLLNWVQTYSVCHCNSSLRRHAFTQKRTDKRDQRIWNLLLGYAGSLLL